MIIDDWRRKQNNDRNGSCMTEVFVHAKKDEIRKSKA